MPDDVRNIAPQPGTVNTGIKDTTIDTGADFVTVAASHGPLLTKCWRRNAAGDPVAEDYGSARVFDFKQKPIRNLDDLANVVADISPTQCLVLGKVKAGVNPIGALRRLHDKPGEPATIEDAAHYWLPIDADSIPANDKRGEFDPLTDPQRAVDCIVKQLPDGFAGADCVWQWSSSAGMKPGIRMRLFFWLSRPLTGAEMKTWLLGCPVDTSIYTPTQPIYAAAPIFDGIVDPIPQRTGAVQGWSPGVMPPAIIATPQTREPRPAPDGFEPDRPENVEQYRRYLRACIAQATSLEAGSGHWSRDGDMNTFRLAAVGKDKGLSPEQTVELLIEELPGGIGADEEWLEITVKNAFDYGSSAPGCDAIPTNEQVIVDVEIPSTEFHEGTVWPLGHNAIDLPGLPSPPFAWAWGKRAVLGSPAINTGDRGTSKTTLLLGLAVAAAGALETGLPVFYLGEPVAPMRSLLMLGEDEYDRAEEMFAGLIRDMRLPDSARCHIHVISTRSDDVPDGPVLCRITADRNNPAQVKVEQTRFMTEAVLPLLDRHAGGTPILFGVDPLDHYVAFDRMNTYCGRAVADRWLIPLCRERGGLVTPFVNDHPSKASMKDGSHYAGAPGLVNAFPAFMSVRKKLDSKNKPIVQEYLGVRQVSLELETMRVKRAPEIKIDLFRIGSSPLLSTRAAEGLSLVATMVRVYEAIEKHRAAKERVRMDRRGDCGFGPFDIAQEIAADERNVKTAMATLCKLHIYDNRKAERGGKPPRDPGGLVKGPMFGIGDLTVEKVYTLMREQGVTAAALPDEKILWADLGLGEGAET